MYILWCELYFLINEYNNFEKEIVTKSFGYGAYYYDRDSGVSCTPSAPSSCGIAHNVSRWTIDRQKYNS